MITQTGECPADSAMPETFMSDFTQGAAAFSGWSIVGGDIAYTQEGAKLAIKKRFDYPTLISQTYLFFGYVEVKIRCARGQGIVTAIVLESDDRDEIDFVSTINSQSQCIKSTNAGAGVHRHTKPNSPDKLVRQRYSRLLQAHRRHRPQHLRYSYLCIELDII
jgi:hypothetical protein